MAYISKFKPSTLIHWSLFTDVQQDIFFHKSYEPLSRHHHAALVTISTDMTLFLIAKVVKCE